MFQKKSKSQENISDPAAAFGRIINDNKKKSSKKKDTVRDEADYRITSDIGFVYYED